MKFNLYYLDEGQTALIDIPRDEILGVVGRVLDNGLEITGIINSEDDI